MGPKFSIPLASPWVRLVLFSVFLARILRPLGQAPSSETLSMHSVVVWLRAHPEPG
jgi:hypothetical protein